MLRFLDDVKGSRIRVTDGEVGHVADCFFDDASWTIRYIVADTGNWLSSRRVLIAPLALADQQDEPGVLRADLTQQQVGESPPVETDKPVSRQLEERLHAHYGWPTYWAARPGLTGLAAPMPPAVGAPEAVGDPRDARRADDPHLRSAREVAGYHIQALDGDIGHVEDFVIDPGRWTIRFAIIDTRNWLPGRKVVFSPDWFKYIDWNERRATTDLTKAAIERSPEYSPSDATST